MLDPKNTRIAVALSGGVDSSVSAYLLKQQGYDIFGLFMKNWQQDDAGHCSAQADLDDVKSVCTQLHIPYHTINLSQQYWDDVFEYFLKEYQAGRTPNPDVLCNRHIKFDAFWQQAKMLGATHMATGHYVRTFTDNKQVKLLRGLDPAKDQSYFLHALKQTQLARSLFPVGHLPKASVRQLAKEAGFRNHKKKDSTGICFIGERKFQQFLSEYLLNQPGDIVTETGDKIGEHQGLMFHTLGQRKGLNIGGLAHYSEAPWYVAKKNKADNTLLVVQDHDHPLLQSTQFECSQMHWIAGDPPADTACRVQIRYQQTAQPCILQPQMDTWQVQFEHSQRAVTPGQFAVFYNGEQCLGGGVINTS